jgi:uncharacterized protein (DUF952 family)
LGAGADLHDGSSIHFSTSSQVRETAAKTLPAAVADLVLIAVDTQALYKRAQRAFRAAIFSHLYGALPSRQWCGRALIAMRAGGTFPDLLWR